MHRATRRMRRTCPGSVTCHMAPLAGAQRTSAVRRRAHAPHAGVIDVGACVAAARATALRAGTRAHAPARRCALADAHTRSSALVAARTVAGCPQAAARTRPSRAHPRMACRGCLLVARRTRAAQQVAAAVPLAADRSCCCSRWTASRQGCPSRARVSQTIGSLAEGVDRRPMLAHRAGP